MKKLKLLFALLVVVTTIWGIALSGVYINAAQLHAFEHDLDMPDYETSYYAYASDEILSECIQYLDGNTPFEASLIIKEKYDESIFQVKLEFEHGPAYLTDKYTHSNLLRYRVQVYACVPSGESGIPDYHILNGGGYVHDKVEYYDSVKISISLASNYGLVENSSTFIKNWAWEHKYKHIAVSVVAFLAMAVTSFFIVRTYRKNNNLSWYPLPFIRRMWSTPFMLSFIALSVALFTAMIFITNIKTDGSSNESFILFMSLVLVGSMLGYIFASLIFGIISKIFEKKFFRELFVSILGESRGVMIQGILLGCYVAILLIGAGILTYYTNPIPIIIATIGVVALWILFAKYLHKFDHAFSEYTNGNWDFTLNERPFLLSNLYANIHILGTTMQIIIEKSVRDERTKTELITNVSHDIKTPLTSIINYTDLLKQDDLSEEQRSEYLDVLSRNSARMKKLLEDLIEASKAATGNIEFTMSSCNINTLVSQAVAEHDRNAVLKNLKIVYKEMDKPIFVLVDGAKLFRVFDNLLSNACKYSLPGSRIFVEINTTPFNQVEISFKNISEQEITLSPDELTERFVRGDMSRHSEGSGLGLAIAKNLTELMNGTLTIETDGDQFKVVLSFSINE